MPNPYPSPHSQFARVPVHIVIYRWSGDSAAQGLYLVAFTPASFATARPWWRFVSCVVDDFGNLVEVPAP